jgi:uncharacterized protein
VKAAPEDQVKLVEVGEIDLALLRITQRLGHLPSEAPLEEVGVELVQAREAQRVALSLVEGLTADLQRAESDVALVVKRIDSDRERLNSSTSAKDAQGLEHELGSLADRLAILEEVQLTVMEQLDTAQKTLDQAVAHADALDRRSAELAAQLHTERTEAEAERQALLARRMTVTATIPEDLLALYDRQRERYGQGVSVLAAGVSSASGVKLTESDLQTIRQAPADDVVLCPDSNAILIRRG